jgi:hypothetical protein
LKNGRFPLCDPAIYCGISLAGNVQAELFYPPLWVLMWLNHRHDHLSYIWLQVLVMAHAWLAFVLAIYWFRLAPTASSFDTNHSRSRRRPHQGDFDPGVDDRPRACQTPIELPGFRRSLYWISVCLVSKS